MTYLKYFWYVIRHKWFVFFECLKLGVPLWGSIIHDWQKFTPAEFKAYAAFGPGTWGNDQRPQWLVDDFEQAWLHHLHYGPHHWDYWLIQDNETPWTIQEHSMGNPPILTKDNKPLLWVEYNEDDDAIHTKANQVLHDVVRQLNRDYKALEMPQRYCREMVADWYEKNSSKNDTASWYAKNRDKIVLHPRTREWVEQQLGVAFND